MSQTQFGNKAIIVFVILSILLVWLWPSIFDRALDLANRNMLGKYGWNTEIPSVGVKIYLDEATLVANPLYKQAFIAGEKMGQTPRKYFGRSVRRYIYRWDSTDIADLVYAEIWRCGTDLVLSYLRTSEAGIASTSWPINASKSEMLDTIQELRQVHLKE